jgi:hypothetical protein
LTVSQSWLFEQRTLNIDAPQKIAFDEYPFVNNETSSARSRNSFGFFGTSHFQPSWSLLSFAFAPFDGRSRARFPMMASVIQCSLKRRQDVVESRLDPLVKVLAQQDLGMVP